MPFKTFIRTKKLKLILKIKIKVKNSNKRQIWFSWCPLICVAIETLLTSIIPVRFSKIT